MKIVSVFLALCLTSAAWADESQVETPHLVITKPIATPEPAPAPQAILPPPGPTVSAEAAKKLSDQAEIVSETCQTPLTARFDWRTFKPEDIAQNSPAAACGQALDALAQACQQPGAQQRIANQIKEVICAVGTQRAVSLHQGALLFTMNWADRDSTGFIYSYLLNNL